MTDQEKNDRWSANRGWSIKKLPKAGKRAMLRPNAWRKHKKYGDGKKS